jgi:hypothetical protein
MGQVAKASLKRLIHGVDPVQQRIRLTGEKVVVAFNRLIQINTGLKGLLGLLHGITGQLEQ